MVLFGVATDGLSPVGRQFSGMVPHGLKKTPKRLGGAAAACARKLRGVMISSHGSAMPMPMAPLSMARREILRGIEYCFMVSSLRAASCGRRRA